MLMGQGQMSVAEMSKRFGISAVSIRKYLRKLESEEEIVRGHGQLDPDDQRQDPGEEEEQEGRADIVYSDPRIVDVLQPADPGRGFPYFAQRRELAFRAGQGIGKLAHFRPAR